MDHSMVRKFVPDEFCKIGETLFGIKVLTIKFEVIGLDTLQEFRHEIVESIKLMIHRLNPFGAFDLGYILEQLHMKTKPCQG